MVTNSQIEKLLNVKVDTYYLLRFQLFDNCKNPFTFKSSLGGGFRAKIVFQANILNSSWISESRIKHGKLYFFVIYL